MDATDAILTRFLGLHPKEIDLSLDRVQRLLAQLGHPERRLPKVVHVAGTNGKGSTIAFMRACLEAAGLRVHVYTSPHLVHFRERIRLGGAGGSALVGEDALVEALLRAEQVNDGAPITLFEITTAAAMLLFAENSADVLLLEVGLGGRLDATNVVDRPLVSVITPVSLDHSKFLGETVAEIAAEKAGIIKRGVPVVVAAQTPFALDVMETVAARAGAPLLVSGQDWQARGERGRLVFEDQHGLLDLPRPRLFGHHQIENAGTAIAALRAAGRIGGPALAQKDFETGLVTVDWPGRMQRLVQGRLVDQAPAEAELWVDGAHNPAGGQVLAAAIGELEERVPRPLVLVAGMLATKDSDGFLQSFSGLAAHVHAVPITSSNAGRPAQEVAETAWRAGIPGTAWGSIEEALAGIDRTIFERPPRIVITGSLYLVGEALAANGTPPQ
jgi:dihydrofolate synthase / folylpolyglutamate synthase